MLLLFFNGQVATATAAIVALTANDPALVASGTVALQPTACEVALTAPPATPDFAIRLVATACELDLIAPPAAPVVPLAVLSPTAANLDLTGGAVAGDVSGVAVVSPSPAIVVLSATPPSVATVLDPAVVTLEPITPVLRVDVGGVLLLTPSPCELALSSGEPTTTVDIWQTAIQIGGVGRADILRRSLQITDALDEAPNTAVFVIASPDPPAVGEEVLIGIGSLFNLIFAGHLTNVDQTFDSSPANLRWHCTAVDYTRLLDRRFVRGRYTGMAAGAIVADLVSKFTSGFTTEFVAGDLPVIDEIEFTWELPTRAITRLAKLIGGYWYVDYERAIHFFITETSEPPDDITDPACSVRALDHGLDITQIRTRVSVEGYGSNAAADVPPGATMIPVLDGVFYSIAGGLVKTGPQRVAYASVITGAGGSTLRGLDGPATALTRALLTGGGLAGNVIGSNLRYVSTFVSTSGETLPSPPSAAVTADQVAAPATAPFPVATVNNAGEGKLVGVYAWRLTYMVRTVDGQIGETTVGPSTGSTTVPTLAVSGSVPAISSAGGAGQLIGAYSYRVSWVTKFGETLAGLTNSRTASAFAAPINAPTASQFSNTVGNLKYNASYKWAVSYVTARGETLPSPVSSVLTPGTITSPGAPSVSASSGGALPASTTFQYAVAFVDGNGLMSNLGSASSGVTTGTTNLTVQISGIATGPTGVVRRAIFRSKAGDAYRYIGDVPDNLTTTFVDDGARSGAAFGGTERIGAQVQVSHSDTPPSGVTRRRFYRTKAGGSSYYLVGEVNSGTSTITDNVPDAALSILAPSTNTAGGDRHQVDVAAGPGAVTALRLYRTRAGGSSYTLLAEFPNVATTFIDDVPDSELRGDTPPTTSSAGGYDVQLTLFNPPSAAEGVYALRIYRTVAGGSTFLLVDEVAAGTLTYTDRKGDDEIGAAKAPTVNTAGGRRVSLTLIPVGPVGTIARRLYRTDDDGVYRLLREIADNVTTSTIDDTAERDLGRTVPAESTIGVLAGDTVIRVVDPSVYRPEGGWIFIGNQFVRYTGVDVANKLLTGIPASGDGSIIAALRVGVDIIAASLLIGVPSSGEGAILYPITRGDAVNILVERDDLAAQAALAAVEGGDGVHEHLVQDNRLSIASATDRALAELAQYATAERRLTFTSRDLKLRSGKTITVDLGPPTNIAGTFKIQQVIFTGFDIPRQYPLRQVTASNYLYTLEHLLRRVELGA